MHQIRREKWTTISEVIVHGKRNVKQKRNWFYFNLSVTESSSFLFNNFKTKIEAYLGFKGCNRLVCHLFGFTSVFEFTRSFLLCEKFPSLLYFNTCVSSRYIF